MVEMVLELRAETDGSNLESRWAMISLKGEVDSLCNERTEGGDV